MTFQSDPFRLMSREPLPADIEQDLLDVDVLASRAADASDVQAGLADRVYRASVHLLPGSPLPLVASRRVIPTWATRRAVVGRIALAASVGLAFVIASQLTVRSTTIQTPGEPAIIVAAIKPLSTAEEWLLVDRVNDMTPNGGERLVEFETPRPTAIDGLVEVSVLSLDQLASDMRDLEASLEM